MDAPFKLGTVLTDVSEGSEVYDALSAYYNLWFETRLGKHPPNVVLNGAFLVLGDSWAWEPVVHEG